jgi:hypothetical protein
MLKKVIANMKNDTYCRIKPDTFGGVGVFAVKDIPKGVNPFKVTTGECINYKTVNVPKKVVDKLKPGVKRIVEAFYAYDEDTRTYGIPFVGLNAQDISFYMNTSKKPNVKVVFSDKCAMNSFITAKKIPKGTQLFINYDEYYDSDSDYD